MILKIKLKKNKIGNLNYFSIPVFQYSSIPEMDNG